MPAEKESNFIDHLARCIPRAAPESPREQARFSPVSSQAQVTWRAFVQQTTTSAASVHYMSTFTQPHAVFTAFTERRNIDLHTVWRIRETAALALSLECYLKGSGPYWLAVYLRKIKSVTASRLRDRSNQWSYSCVVWSSTGLLTPRLLQRCASYCHHSCANITDSDRGETDAAATIAHALHHSSEALFSRVPGISRVLVRIVQ